jgi:hypothetical protein
MGSIINKMIESGIVQKAMPNPQLPPNPNFGDLGKYAVDKSQNILSNIFSGQGVAYPQTPPQTPPQNVTGFGGLGSLISNFLKQRFGQQSPNNEIGIGDFERDQSKRINSLRNFRPFGLNFSFMNNGLNSNQIMNNPMTPSELTINQINALAPKDRLSRSLNLAGFGQDDITRILANRGFANGGYVNTNLTTTIPPDRGPSSQGIQTLLARRYR